MLHGLRARLIVLVLAVAVPLGAFVAYQIAHLGDHLREEALEETETDARLVAVSLERFVHQLAEQGQAVGEAVTAGGMSQEEAEAYLRSLGRHVPISNMTVLRPDGTAIASAIPVDDGDPLQELSAFREVANGSQFAVSRVRENATGNPGLVVTTPIAGQTEAIAAVAIDGEDLSAIVPVEASDGHIVIVDGEGTVAYTDYPALSDRVGQAGSFESGLFEESSGRGLALPGTSESYVGARSAIGDTGWQVLFYRSEQLAAQHEFQETRTAAVAVALVFALATFLTWRASAAVLDPVKRLTVAAERISGGDLDSTVHVEPGPQEIATLAEGFRDMQSSLSRTFSAVESVAEAGRALNATMDSSRIAQVGLDSLARLLHAEEGVLRLFGEGRKEDRFFGHQTDDPRALATSLGWEVPEHALRTRDRAMVLESTAVENRFIVSLPLRVQDSVLGRVDLVAVPPHGTAEFQRSDVELAAGLARQVATALSNAAQFETECMIAEILQDSLLTKPFEVPGLSLGLTYRPSTTGAKVGGDFYDFVQVDAHTLGVVLGDISGKGIMAARHTATAKGAIRAFILDDPSPARVLTRASIAIAEQLEVGTFVTAFYALVDTRDGRVTYSTAGHPAPFVRSAEGAASVLFAGGPPLGVVPGYGYEEAQTVLSKDDALVIFSDGLTEARERNGRLLGEEGVAEVLLEAPNESQALAEALASAAEEHAHGELLDDLAVVVVSRSDGPTEGMRRERPGRIGLTDLASAG